MDESHWTPACAGVTIVFEAHYQFSTVIPAHAGIQRLSFINKK